MPAFLPEYLDWHEVSSSNVARIAYDAGIRRVYVEFHSGGGGYYAGVPADVWQAFLDAGSKGSFVYYVLRGGQPKGAGYHYQSL